MADQAWVNPHLEGLLIQQLGTFALSLAKVRADNALLKERLSAALKENADLKAAAKPDTSKVATVTFGPSPVSTTVQP